LEDLSADESIILKSIFKESYGGMDWIDVIEIGGGLF